MVIERLKIGGRRYEVTWEADGNMVADGCAGQCNHDGGVIKISALGRSLCSKAEVLMHECLHAMFDDAGIGLEDEVEEGIVRALSPRICAFMGDNPEALLEVLDALMGDGT